MHKIYKGALEVHDTGEVYRLTKKGKKLAALTSFYPHGKSRPYILTTYSINGKQKQVYVSRIVAELFIPNPDNLKCVELIDGNPYNLCKDNLRWVSHDTISQKIAISRKSKRKSCIDCGCIIGARYDTCFNCRARERRLEDRKARFKDEFKGVDMNTLPIREQSILQHRLNGDTMEVIGDRHCITRERVRQLLTKIKENRGTI